MGAKGWDLAKANHLWPQIIQSLLVSCLKKLSSIRSEETALVKRHHIRLQLLYGEIREATHQCRLQVFVLDIFTIKIVLCTLIDDVD